MSPYDRKYFVLKYFLLLSLGNILITLILLEKGSSHTVTRCLIIQIFITFRYFIQYTSLSLESFRDIGPLYGCCPFFFFSFFFLLGIKNLYSSSPLNTKNKLLKYWLQIYHSLALCRLLKQLKTSWISNGSPSTGKTFHGDELPGFCWFKINSP